MATKKGVPGMGRWLALTALSAVIGAATYETLRRRFGWRGYL